MALNWSWSEKCGELTVVQGEDEFTLNLYQGNALLIALYEYKKREVDMYDMFTFWADKEHMKRCLGTAKKTKNNAWYNMYDDNMLRFTKIRLNKAKNRYWKDIVKEMATAFDDLTIELYSEKEKE